MTILAIKLVPNVLAPCRNVFNFLTFPLVYNTAAQIHFQVPILFYGKESNLVVTLNFDFVGLENGALDSPPP